MQRKIEREIKRDIDRERDLDLKVLPCTAI